MKRLFVVCSGYLLILILIGELLRFLLPPPPLGGDNVVDLCLSVTVHSTGRDALRCGGAAIIKHIE